MPKKPIETLTALHTAHNYVDRTILFLLISRGLLKAHDVIDVLRREAAELDPAKRPEALQVLTDLADSLEIFAAEEEP
jgi:hypothetical protein